MKALIKNHQQTTNRTRKEVLERKGKEGYALKGHSPDFLSDTLSCALSVA